MKIRLCSFSCASFQSSLPFSSNCYCSFAYFAFLLADFVRFLSLKNTIFQLSTGLQSLQIKYDPFDCVYFLCACACIPFASFEYPKIFPMNELNKSWNKLTKSHGCPVVELTRTHTHTLLLYKLLFCTVEDLLLMMMCTCLYVCTCLFCLFVVSLFFARWEGTCTKQCAPRDNLSVSFFCLHSNSLLSSYFPVILTPKHFSAQAFGK